MIRTRRPQPMTQLRESELPALRQDILQIQGGICPICKREITDPCLDHHHKKRIKGTGQIRGVLCRTCNVFIAKSENNCVRMAIPYKDLPIILRNMAEYLEQKQYPYIHPSEGAKPKKLQKSVYIKLTQCMKGQKRKVPPYPRGGKLTKELAQLFEKYGIEPLFYAEI